VGRWCTAGAAQLQCAILAAFALTPSSYTLTQLRYDLRKMKAHGIIERDGSRYAYRLTDKGRKVALLFVLFQQRVCGPLANSLFNHPPDPECALATPLETAYRKADESIQQILELLAA
jgi:hypothetical protein